MEHKANNQNDENNRKNEKSQLPGMPGMGNQNPLKRWWPLLLILLMFLTPWIFNLFAGFGSNNQISYSFFIDQLEDGNVRSIMIQGEKIEGSFNSAVTVPSADASGQGPQINRFMTYYPESVSQDFLNRLKNSNISVYTRPESQGSFLSILLNLLPFLFLIWIFWRLSKGMRSGGQGLFQVGKSKAKKYDKKEDEHTRFSDIAGIESAKNELVEIVDFLKQPEKYKKFGAKTPTGVLLVGPPGTGKTLLARAVAGEADVPFFSISGSDFMEMFVGVGASRVRDLFKEAKKKQPSIIFIDELDSIGRSRGAGLGGGHDEREQTLNQLLSELDGFEQDESTIILAATNRPDILDNALLRPGRFDRRITTNLPPKKDRLEILKIHSKEKKLSKETSLDRLARNTPGFSGADLANLLNEAALLAIQAEKDEIEQSDLNNARDKILLGLERKSVVMSEKEKRIVSFHESGHALVAAVMEHAEPVHKVTIVPRERSMGVTQQLPEEDKYIYDRHYLEDRLAVMMGGRAAENIKTATATSGAENDLKQAQKLARKMVLDWGMSAEFENIALGGERENVFLGEQIAQKKDYSEDTNRRVDAAVQKILNEAYKRANSTLQEYSDGLEKLAETLLENEEISGRDVYSILGIDHEDESTAS
jgi:cell division protease FtsH